MHSINFICQKGHMGEVFGVKRRGGRIVLTPFFFFFFFKYCSNSFKYTVKHYH